MAGTFQQREHSEGLVLLNLRENGAEYLSYQPALKRGDDTMSKYDSRPQSAPHIFVSQARRAVIRLVVLGLFGVLASPGSLTCNVKRTESA